MKHEADTNAFRFVGRSRRGRVTSRCRHFPFHYTLCNPPPIRDRIVVPGRPRFLFDASSWSSHRAIEISSCCCIDTIVISGPSRADRVREGRIRAFQERSAGYRNSRGLPPRSSVGRISGSPDGGSTHFRLSNSENRSWTQTETLSRTPNPLRDPLKQKAQGEKVLAASLPILVRVPKTLRAHKHGQSAEGT